MKAAKERAIQDKGGVPLEEGEKWLLTTKACHDLLNDRAERRRMLIAHEKKEEEFKMTRRGRKTLPGDLVCQIMSDTMAHRLIRDDETGFGGKNMRQELLKKESELSSLTNVVMAANRFLKKGNKNSTVDELKKKKKEQEDVPRYGYPTFTYIDELTKLTQENNNQNIPNEHVDTTIVSDENSISSSPSYSKDNVLKTVSFQETKAINDDISKSQTQDGVDPLGSPLSINTNNDDDVSITGKEDADDEEESLASHHSKIINKFQNAAHKGVSRKKLRSTRLRMILPVGEENGQEAIFWEKVGVPRVIPGKEEKSKKSELHDNKNTGGGHQKFKKKTSRDNRPKNGTTSDETLGQTKAKIRMNQEMGWRPGLLRQADVVDEDPNGWLRTARQQRTIAKEDDPLERLFWEKEGRPPLPDPFAISEEVSKFLRLNINEEEEKKKNDKEDNEEQEGKDEEAEEFGGFKGTFKWVEEMVDTSGGNTGMGGVTKRRPDGRVHHTLTAFPACWSPKKGEAGADWLRPGMSLVFMFGGRCFVQPPPARRGDPSKGRYRPSPTKPTNELWSYTPQLFRWQNLTDFCTGKGSGPRSRHTTAIVKGTNDSVNLFVFGGLDLHNNSKNDLFVLNLTTLAWTEVLLRGVPPPVGLGAACLTEKGKDLIVTKDKDVVADTDAERKNGIPAAMGVWRLKISVEDPHASNHTWLGLWSRAPRRLPPHGAGHTISTLGRSQVVFGGLSSKSGDVVSMALGTLKVLGSEGGYINPILESNSAESIQTKQDILEARQRNRERRRKRRDIKAEDDDSDSEEDDLRMRKNNSTMLPQEKELQPLPRRFANDAGAIGQRLIASPDPARAIRHHHTAVGTKEEGRFRNPLRDGREEGSLGNIPVKDVSKLGMRKLLCGSDKKFKEHIESRPSSTYKVPKQLMNNAYAQNAVGGSTLDDWLKMTEKASEEHGGQGGRGDYSLRGSSSNGGGDDGRNNHHHHNNDHNISDDEGTIVHLQTLPTLSQRQHAPAHLTDVKEQPYFDVSYDKHDHNRPSHSRQSNDETRTSSRQSRGSRRSVHIGNNEFAKGGQWEPAEWVRPWARAGIKRLSDPPLRQYHAAAAVSKRHLVICGGELGGPLSDSVSEESEGKYRVSSGVYLLDLQTSEWSQLPVCNPVRRAGHALVCVDGKLLSFGGRSAPLPATKPFPSDLLCLHYDG